MTTQVVENESYQKALHTLRQTLDKLDGCTPQEKAKLQADMDRLHQMVDKLTRGRVEITSFSAFTVWAI